MPDARIVHSPGPKFKASAKPPINVRANHHWGACPKNSDGCVFVETAGVTRYEPKYPVYYVVSSEETLDGGQNFGGK